MAGWVCRKCYHRQSGEVALMPCPKCGGGVMPYGGFAKTLNKHAKHNRASQRLGGKPGLRRALPPKTTAGE